MRRIGAVALLPAILPALVLATSCGRSGEPARPTHPAPAAPSPASAPATMPPADEMAAPVSDECLGYNGLDGANPPAKVRAGLFRTHTTKPVRVAKGTNVDWGLDPYNDRSWQLWLHSLEWLGGLIEQYGRTHDPEMIKLAAGITRDWLKDNEGAGATYFGQERSEAISQAAKFRLITLTCLRAHYKARWLDKAIAGHAAWLARPENYSGPWNHGLDESMILMTAGCRIGRNDLAGIGYRRMVDAVLDPPGRSRPAIDAQGANNEQSTHYSVYNRGRWRLAIAAMRRCNRKVPAELERRHRLLDEFIAFQSTPAGDMLQIGESYAATVSGISQPGTGPIRYVISRGREGTKPAARVRVYKAGYLMGRSGWGDRGRAYEAEMSYTARFGPGRYAHGQNDHMELTFHAKGRDILVPSGHIGYSDPEWRAFLRSPRSHNTLVVDGATFRSDVTTPLTAHRFRPGADFFRFTDGAFTGTTRTRSVLAASDPDVMVVLDETASASPRHVEQLWHLPAAFRATAKGAGAVATAGSVRVHFLRVGLPGGGTEPGARVIRGARSPLQGWIVPTTRKTVKAPTVVIPADGARTRTLTLIVPVDGAADGKGAPAVKTRKARKGGLLVEVTVAGKRLVVEVSAGGALRRVG